MLAKGFIGPIGDDLPSLIPLLVGLVMFFSTFSVTFNAFDARNAEFDHDIALMRISRVLQSNSYIFSYRNFEALCSQVGVSNLNFVGAISNGETTPGSGDASGAAEIKNIFDIGFFTNGEGQTFYCTNVTGVDSPKKFSDIITLKEAADLQFVSRIYPIVVEDNKVVKPMHLYVVAWK
ncbi:MAG: hypothetical protein AABW99_03510 [archaeon]